jgi:hypothetical protein
MIEDILQVPAWAGQKKPAEAGFNIQLTIISLRKFHSQSIIDEKDNSLIWYRFSATYLKNTIVETTGRACMTYPYR